MSLVGRPPSDSGEGHPALLVVRDPARIAALSGSRDEASRRRSVKYAQKVVEGVFAAEGGELGTFFGESGYAIDGRPLSASQNLSEDTTVQVVRFRPETKDAAVSPEKAAEIGATAVSVIKKLMEFDSQQPEVGSIGLNPLTYLGIPEEYVAAYAAQAPGDHTPASVVTFQLELPELSPLEAARIA